MTFDSTYDCNSVIPLDFGLSNVKFKRNSIPYIKTEIKPTKPKSKSFDIVIIGGGLSGSYISCQIKSLFPKLNILILDENKYFLNNFHKRTQNIGQQTLRSPYSQQLAPDSFIQLIDYARLHTEYLLPNEIKQIRMAQMGQRSIVPLDIFLKHCYHVINSLNLYNSSYRTSVEKIEKEDGIFKISARDSIFYSKSLISATGSSIKNEKNTNTINGYNYLENIDKLTKEDKILIVGSGLTSAYIIYDLIKSGFKVNWEKENDIRIRCSDVSTKYFREEGCQFYEKLNNYEKIKILQQENRGSIMPEFESFLKQSITNGELKIVKKGSRKTFSKIIECTGLVINQKLIDKSKTVSNYPLIDENLQIDENHFVIGQNASLKIGASAKNIDGFRLAAEKIIPSISKLFNQNLNYESKFRLITGKRMVL